MAKNTDHIWVTPQFAGMPFELSHMMYMRPPTIRDPNLVYYIQPIWSTLRSDGRAFLLCHLWRVHKGKTAEALVQRNYLISHERLATEWTQDIRVIQPKGDNYGKSA